MKKLLRLVAIASVFCLTIVSCNNATNQSKPGEMIADLTSSNIKEEAVSYSADSLQCKGFVYYDEKKEGKRPAVLVVHEWWGLNDYAKSRARQLAEMGYIAMAVDMYGNSKTAENPQEAGALASVYYQHPELTKRRLDAALRKVKEFSQSDTSNVAAIGYCFGGFVILNAAKQGADLKGVVSFHGSLSGVQPDKNLLKAKVLVCHGGDDKFVPAPEVNAFKKGMDLINADYTFKVYANATHAFTNPEATANGKKFNMPIEYNAAADSASWNDMKDFFAKIFTGK